MKLGSKVVISANTSWYLYNFRKNTIIALVDAGYEVVAVAPIDDYSAKISDIGASFYNINIDQGGINPFRDLFTFFSFAILYKKIRPDLILNFTPKNNIYSTLAAYFFGIKSINNVAGLGKVFINNNLLSKIVRLLYRFSQQKAHLVFFQNDEDKALFVKYNLVSPVNAIRIPGSGVDLNRFSLREAPDDGYVSFLLISRMLYEKGIGIYVDAARVLKEKYGGKVEFMLLGSLDINNPSSISRSNMECWVDEGIVTYLGTSDNVEFQIALADCIVLPSFYREGVPKSLLEACAMGKPIVTSDNVGCRETVDDGVNGYLCESRSTSSLIHKLELMIQHSHAERLRMGLHSRKKAEEQFDEKVVIQKYIESVNKAI